MKKILGLALILFLLLPGFSYADPAMQVKSIDVVVDVDLSNTYHVTETIGINFQWGRRGIIRDIDRRFYGYSHEIKDISVTDENGKPYKFTTDKRNDILEIRIGDANVYVDGPMTYVINYSFVMGSDRNSEFDQVYWNLIGNQWSNSIESTSFRVNMPKSFESTASTLNVTRGRYGSTAKAEWEIEGNSVIGTAGSLRPYEGLTFRLDLEEGYFTEAPEPYNRLHFLAYLGAMGAIVLLALGIKRKNAAHNEIIPVVSFEPPYDLNPPEIGYMDSEELITNEGMATLITYWASKGYLQIVETTKTGILGGTSAEFKFLRKADADVIDNYYERRLFQRMFKHGNGQKVTMKQLQHKFYRDVELAKKELRGRFVGDREILVNSYQYLPAILVVIGLIVSIAFIGNQVAWLFGILPVIGYILTGLVMGVILFVASWIQSKKNNTAVTFGCLGMILVPLAGYAIYMYSSRSAGVARIFRGASIPKITDPWLLLVLASVALTGLFFYSLLGIKKYTDFAKEHLSQIRGFKDFLSKVKTEELNMLFDTNPNYYYDMLPYVYIFGLTDIWEEHLKQLTLPAPEWYTGDGPFYPRTFRTNLNTNFSQATSPPPQQSSSSGSRGGSGGGFGGGGFSGGGGGGGGGRSW